MGFDILSDELNVFTSNARSHVHFSSSGSDRVVEEYAILSFFSRDQINFRLCRASTGQADQLLAI
jgi:hypothetical protein